MNKKILLILLFIIIGVCSFNSVSAHEGMENPIVVVDNLKPNSEVSGDVGINITVHEHNEVKYVNVTAEHMESREIYFNKQDSNPNDGWFISWDTSNAPNGEYWITVTACDVKGLDGKCEMKLILNNHAKESKIIMESPTVVVNKSTNIFASLKDNNSNPISGKTIEFIIDKTSYYANTTNDGFASVSFTPKEVKNYNILVKFAGDNKYLKSQTESIVKVMSNINTTTITINNVKGNNKENIILTANLQCPGIYGSNSNKKIEFYINNRFIGSNTTDEKGQAKLSYFINETGGNYIYQVKYQNETGYNFTDYASLYVPQSELYITLKAITHSIDGLFTIGNTFKLNYTIHNIGPDSAENTMIKYEIPDSLKYLQSQASKGNVSLNSNILTWNLDELEIGEENLEISFEILSAGRINLSPSISTITYDKSLNSSDVNKFLTVNTYQLKANNLVKYYGAGDKYRVYVYSQNQTPVSGAYVKITINKSTFNLRTNALGYVELAVNLECGKYDVKCSCAKLTLSNKITIKPIVVTKNINKKKSKKIKFTAKLLNSHGKIIKNKKIVFKIKGKKYSAKTNNRGIANIVLKNLKVGKHSIQTSYGGCSVKNIIKIK